ncbi:hypothetical protein HZS_4744, partial [Henneguya salminicola]
TAHLIFPKQYKISYRNKNFLLYDGLEKKGERFILFAASCQLNILSRRSPIYFDSTITPVSEIFYKII